MMFTLDLIHSLFRIDSVAVFNLSGIGRGMEGGRGVLQDFVSKVSAKGVRDEELLFVSYSSS